ncbi:MAG: hypothetical protein K8I60_21530 [Anaerolineae bacterium]|nr:hypothetical protein [Anaerolineae bacterium]
MKTPTDTHPDLQQGVSEMVLRLLKVAELLNKGMGHQQHFSLAADQKPFTAACDDRDYQKL